MSTADRTITIPAGTRTIALPAITFSSDGRYEDQEQLVLTLTSPLSNSVAGSFIGTTNSKKILINNAAADVAPTVSITTATGTSAEGAAASVGFNVTLDAAAGKDMYVKYVLSTDSGDYTNDMAEEGEDFSLPDALADRVFLIPAYATTLASPKTITLINDDIYEYTEDIVIDLETYTTDATAALTVNNLAKTYTYTITEADAAPIL